MILYDLKCSNGHQFEAWFRDSGAFDAQCKRGEVECPLCSETDISKAPMAPRVAKSRNREGGEKRAGQVAREILDAVGKVQKHVEDNCEYVGDNFADEARAIHYGDAEERGIYGEATETDAGELIEEDIPVQRIPWRNRNNS